MWKKTPMVRARESRIQKANQLNPNSKSDYSIDVKVDREAEIQTRHQYVSLCTDKLAMSLKISCLSKECLQIEGSFSEFRPGVILIIATAHACRLNL